MAVRLSGLNSGLDTEAIIKELMSTQSGKLTKVKNSKTKLEWKEEKWQELNKKIYALYTDELSKFKAQSSYLTKEVATSDSSKATITASSKVPAGTHTVGISSVASAQYVTGTQIKSFTSTNGETIAASKVKSSTTLTTLGIHEGTTFTLATKGGESKEFTVKSSTKISDLTEFAKKQGVNLTYDENNGRFFASSVESGSDNAFSLTCSTASSNTAASTKAIKETVGFDYLSTEQQEEVRAAMDTMVQSTDSSSEEYKKANLLLQKYAKAVADTKADPDSTTSSQKFKEILNSNIKTTMEDTNFNTVDADLNTKLGELKTSYEGVGKTALELMGLTEIGFDGVKNTSSGVSFVEAKDCVVEYNGATYKNNTNTVVINGLTINAIETTGSTPLKVSVSNNADSVYKMVKSFVSTYNKILKEANELYTAAPAKGYDVLTDDERKVMTEEQIEKWENKIKGSLLRNDTALANVRSSLTSISSMSVTIDGKAYSLSSFGIAATDYTEKGLLHIAGDSEDTLASGNEDKLMKAIGEDPDLVMQVLSGIGSQLYSKLTDKMSSSSVSSAFKFYNDKQITSQKKAYDTEITKWEKKLTEIENRYYSKFSAMESAISKINAKTGYLSSMFG